MAGIAVVSAIATAEDPQTSTQALCKSIDAAQISMWPFAQPSALVVGSDLASTMGDVVRQLFEKTRTDGRVVQQITNTVSLSIHHFGVVHSDLSGRSCKTIAQTQPWLCHAVP